MGNGNPTMLFIVLASSVSNKVLYTSCFPPDVAKYTGYEKILESSSFGRLCSLSKPYIENNITTSLTLVISSGISFSLCCSPFNKIYYITYPCLFPLTSKIPSFANSGKGKSEVQLTPFFQYPGSNTLYLKNIFEFKANCNLFSRLGFSFPILTLKVYITNGLIKG